MRVLAAGTLMVDIMAMGLPRLAEPGEVLYTDVETHIGGHPIDVAIDLVETGASPDAVAVAAAVGTGPFGDFVRRVIGRYGIRTFLQEVPDRDTGRNLVLGVEGRDRRLHIDPGANWLLLTDHVAAALASWEPDLFTVRPGYTGIDLTLGEILAPLEGTTVLVDLMRPHPSRPPDYLAGALTRADIVHVNEREALLNTATETVEDAAASLLDRGVKLVLVTAQERGASAFTQRFEVRQPPFSVEAVDATGCGDAFCAGVIRMLGERGHSRDLDLSADELVDLLAEAQAVGASAATAIGCVEGVSAEIVDHLLSSQAESVRDATKIIERSKK